MINIDKTRFLISEQKKKLRESRLIISDLKKKLQDEETNLNFSKMKLDFLEQEEREYVLSLPDERETNEAAIDAAFMNKLDDLMKKV